MSKTSLKNKINEKRLSLIGEKNKKGEVTHYVVCDPHINKKIKRLRNNLSTVPHPDWGNEEEASAKENR